MPLPAAVVQVTLTLPPPCSGTSISAGGVTPVVEQSASNDPLPLPAYAPPLLAPLVCM